MTRLNFYSSFAWLVFRTGLKDERTIPSAAGVVSTQMVDGVPTPSLRIVITRKRHEKYTQASGKYL